MRLPAGLLKYLKSEAFSQTDLLKRHLDQRIDLANQARGVYYADTSEANKIEADRVTQ